MKIAVTHHGGMCAAWHGRYAFGCIINDVVRGIIAESSAEQVAVQELQVGACLGSGLGSVRYSLACMGAHVQSLGRALRHTTPSERYAQHVHACTSRWPSPLLVATAPRLPPQTFRCRSGGGALPLWCTCSPSPGRFF